MIGCGVPELWIMIAIVLLMPLMLGLPLLLKPDSPIPDRLGFGLLAVMLLFCMWSLGLWWVLLPILALVALVAWLDREGPAPKGAAAAGDGPRLGARLRLRLRLWGAARLASLALIVSLFFLPAGSASTIVLPGLMIGMAATTLFRFSFARALRRGADGGEGTRRESLPGALEGG